MKGIYVHVPFCAKKCDYCDFYSVGKIEESAGTVAAVLAEINSQEWRTPVSTIYIGGGTPTCLPCAALCEIIDALPKGHREFTVECNPGTVDLAYLQALRQRGVNRISIGCQSTHDTLLKKIGRIHTHAEFLNVFNAARAAGFTNINADLMFALPGQSLADWQTTLHEIAALRPEHISCYALTPAEGTPLADYEPCEILDRQMYHYARAFLAEKGYEHYEISNWALPGCECRHNTDCWEMKPYIGLGPGASGFDGVYRYRHSRALTAWHISEKIPVDTEKERIMLGLRMLKGIPADLVRSIPPALLGPNPLVGQEDGRIRLTARGLDFANTVFEAFL